MSSNCVSISQVYKGKLNDSEVCVKYFHPQQKSLFLTEKEIYSVLSPDVKTIVQCLACDECPQPDGATKVGWNTG